MKEIMGKIANICKLIFGYCIMIILLLGGITFFGYLIAFIIGGEIAQNICEYIYRGIIPIMIYLSTCTVLFGLFTMYLAGEKALTTEKKESKKSK